MTILTVEKLTKSFGGLTAVSNVSMQIEKGELVGIIDLTEPENHLIQLANRSV